MVSRKLSAKKIILAVATVVVVVAVILGAMLTIRYVSIMSEKPVWEQRADELGI